MLSALASWDRLRAAEVSLDGEIETDAIEFLCSTLGDPDEANMLNDESLLQALEAVEM